MKIYVVYILTNKPRGTLYIGVTSDLKRRITEHRLGFIEGFTKKYNLKKLVYFEQFAYVNKAIAREKQLKHFLRQWKEDDKFRGVVNHNKFCRVENDKF